MSWFHFSCLSSQPRRPSNVQQRPRPNAAPPLSGVSSAASSVLNRSASSSNITSNITGERNISNQRVQPQQPSLLDRNGASSPLSGVSSAASSVLNRSAPSSNGMSQAQASSPLYERRGDTISNHVNNDNDTSLKKTLLAGIKRWKDSLNPSFETNAEIIQALRSPEEREEAGSRIIACFEDETPNLDLSDLNLTSIPPEIYLLTQLEELNLDHNPITEVPRGIENLQNLRRLNMSSTLVTALPEGIEQLTNLTHLSVEESRIEVIPQTIGSLRSLTSFNLHHTRVRGVPLGLFDLPRTCTVDLTGCPIPATPLGRIRSRIGEVGYNGPTVHHSIVQRDPHRRLQMGLQALIDEVYRHARKKQPSLNHLLSNQDGENDQDKSTRLEHLRRWLAKLGWTADSAEPTQRKKMATAIAGYLERANQNPEFREVLTQITEEDSTSCGDRVALGLIQFEMYTKLVDVDIQDQPRLVELLINNFKIDQIFKIAREKVLALRYVDEIEVYLALIMKLKDRLQLNISTQNMLYYASSNLTEDDINGAFIGISASLQDLSALSAYLVNQKKWRDSLAQQQPVQYAKALENSEHMAEALTTLTKTVLQGIQDAQNNQDNNENNNNERKADEAQGQQPRSSEEINNDALQQQPDRRHRLHDLGDNNGNQRNPNRDDLD